VPSEGGDLVARRREALLGAIRTTEFKGSAAARYYPVERCGADMPQM
jgi:hypothetical protein